MGHGKVMNFRPGKVMESYHGEVMEFQIFSEIVFS